MIKAETTLMTKEGVRGANIEVTLDGTGREIFHEFIGVLRSMKEECPELLLVALRKYEEEIEHDN